VLDHESECYIHRIGTAVPEQSLNPDQAAQLLEGGCINPRSIKLLHRVVRLTGIEKRHLAALDFQQEDNPNKLYKLVSQQPRGPGMSDRTSAFQKACDPLVRRAMSAFTPEDLAGIQMLVTASCTHASSPGLEAPIFTHTPVPVTVDRWNLGFMGCSAGLAAMRMIHRTASHEKHALIVACELSSLHFQYTDELDQMTANLIFADGAAAMILSPRRSPVRVLGCCCVALPDFAHQMVWFAGDHGLQLELSQDLTATLSEYLPSAVSDFLRDQGISKDGINHWLVHPGGPQILDGVQRALSLPENALHLSRLVLKNYGNMSSPTIFFIMKQLFESGATGDVLAIAFGPGLTIEMVHMRIQSAA
jgi:predicted naringenin-chalcone synthase